MPSKILTALFILQAILFYGFSRGEPAVLARPLREFPVRIGDWRMLHQNAIDEDVSEMLRADDYLTRDYSDSHKRLASLFVAFFKSQRAGQSPHSPKNCLPGAGWIWSVADTVRVMIPGRPVPIEVNRYIVSNGDEKATVLYWYQSRGRVVASEYRAAAFTAWDALRYNRTDTALIRIVIPIAENDQSAAMRAGVNFIQTIFTALRGFFPN